MLPIQLSQIRQSLKAANVAVAKVGRGDNQVLQTRQLADSIKPLVGDSLTLLVERVDSRCDAVSYLLVAH